MSVYRKRCIVYTVEESPDFLKNISSRSICSRLVISCFLGFPSISTKIGFAPFNTCVKGDSISIVVLSKIYLRCINLESGFLGSDFIRRH